LQCRTRAKCPLVDRPFTTCHFAWQSSYQTREKGADKVRRHRLVNHEPPRGISNRPSSPTPRKPSQRPASPEWIVLGHPTKRSPREVPAHVDTLIFHSAERLAMLKAAKSSLTAGNTAISTSLLASRHSPRICAPEVSGPSGASEYGQETIPPYRRSSLAPPGANSSRTSVTMEGDLSSAASKTSPLNSTVSDRKCHFRLCYLS
jgi:hypothetical protein